MTSRLKSLELHGYKTFASHTNFVFAEAVTAIVGPNGSGKSNIADSIRWVLGEQSFSLLRGKKTEDMIFSGSELRPRASMASATLIFDNSDGWLPIDFTEVAVTRRAYRDGENEYLLNGQRVRLKDISELLARSGLAERTYTVIGQGLVDAALALKAEERRRLFEEAAGISLYRSRREEAFRRLETTRHNLERVQDILAELLPRLRSLERQAKRAQEYDQVRADLRLLLRDWYGYHWHQSQHELTDTREVVRQAEAALEQEYQDHALINEKLVTFRERLTGLRARLNSWHRQSSQLHSRRETISRDLAVSEERTRSVLEQQQSLQAELARLDEELGLHHERLENANREANSLTIELEEARTHVESARQELQARQYERTTAENAVLEARQTLSALITRQGNMQARLAERQAQAQRQEEAIQISIRNVEAADRELNLLEAQLEKKSQTHRQAEISRQTIEDVLQTHRQQIADGEIARRKTLETRSALQTAFARLTAQSEVLEQAENTFTGYANGTRLLLQAAREARLKGVHGALSNLLEVPAEYEAAIAAALGEYMDAVILEGEANTEDAMQKMSTEIARAALLPLDTLIPSDAISFPLPREATLASSVVQCAPEFRPALDLLLGNAWIVADRSIARALVRKLRSSGQAVPTVRVISMRGEVFHANGPILAGQESKAGVLGRPRQRRELRGKLGDVETQLLKVDDTLRQVDQAFGQLRTEEEWLKLEVNRAREAEKTAQSAYSQEELTVERTRRQHQFLQEQYIRLNSEISLVSGDTQCMTEELVGLEEPILQARNQLRERSAVLNELSLDELQTQLSHWYTRTAVAERAVADAQNRLREQQVLCNRVVTGRQEAQARWAELHLAHDAHEKEKTGLRAAQGVVNVEIGELQLLIDPSEKELEVVEGQQEQTQTIGAQARQKLSQAEHHHAQARINLVRRQETLDGLRQRIEDDFGLVAFDYADEVSGPTPLPLDGMVEQLPKLIDLPLDLEENIRRQRAQLRRMGPINPEAQKEHEEVQQRYEFLTVQVADLHKAEEGIKEVIAELDLLMEREFRKTFDAVAREFREIFSRLFGGGTARLVLTDPQNLTMTGIDIEARLPGRREQGLTLLSGGERSLTASALVFSLLKVSPTPFCVFDEVDAMLDEANVGRFRELLEELSQSTQFVIITHNRNTVQVADVIYGITMGRDSASQVVSLKLDEVSRIVE
jgi:chromosome segregation protein